LPFASLVESGFVLEPESEGGWHPRGDNAFVFRELRGSPEGLLDSVAAQHSRPEYQAVASALRAHPVIGTRLGKLVGTAFSREVLAEDRVADGLVYRFLRRGSFDAAEFDTAFEQLLELLTSDTAAWVVIAPLSGVASDATPIELEPGVEIIAMSDAEVIACLSTSLMTGFGSAGFPSLANRIAIRLTEQWPVIVDNDNADGAATQAHSRRTELVEAVVHVLRLLKDGEVSVPGTVAFTPSSFEGRAYHFGYSPAPRHSAFERYRLEPADVDELVALWRDVRSSAVQGKRFLVTAMRRFAFGGERPRPEDRILDLMIAAEALFTPGTQTEVSHKVALQASAFLDRQDATAADVFRTMKQGYSARSAMAHGGEPDIGRLAGGEEGTLDRLVAVLSDYMRDALKRMVTRAVGGTALSDQGAWNKLVLDKLTGSAERTGDPTG
jgi:Apea-like HEPN